MRTDIRTILDYLDTDPPGAIRVKGGDEIYLPEINTWIACNGHLIATVTKAHALRIVYPWFITRMQIRRHVREWIARQEHHP